MLRGLIIFIVIVVFLLAQGPQAYNTLRGWLGADWNWWERDAVTAPERVEGLAAKGLREQLISFEQDMMSVEYRYGAPAEVQRYNIYAIGVGQVTLNEPEEAPRVMAVAPPPPPAGPSDVPNELPSVFAAQTSSVTGRFNNVVIFDRRTGEFTKLFDKRLAISQFQYGWQTKREVLIIFATELDSNKDGKLDDDDLQDIYVYTFADKKMHRIDAPSLRPVAIMDIPDVDYVVVKAIYDRNGDGTTSTYGRSKSPDPYVLTRVDLKTFTASPFVPPEMLQELQSTLDGAKPVAPAAGATAPAPAQTTTGD